MFIGTYEYIFLEQILVAGFDFKFAQLTANSSNLGIDKMLELKVHTQNKSF